MNEFTHRIATFNDIPDIEKLMKLSIDQLLGPLLTTDPVSYTHLTLPTNREV